jgi:uncharacterized integral membrane protein (TIGR00701 family)
VNIYAWAKAFHIVAVIAWMAGMLYLPRLFVYHCTAAKDSVQSETFKTMERRLLRGIINPAMIATWVLGLLLLAASQDRAGSDPVGAARIPGPLDEGFCGRPQPPFAGIL